jgi:8-oxo-dGTP pyrophosphatase MutT (NUDIX family)
MDILPIQASAVPCERVFSSAKETMTLRRSRIGPDLMEALQMLKFSLRNGRYLDFTAGTTKEEELEALEMEMREELGIPDDNDVHLIV